MRSSAFAMPAVVAVLALVAAPGAALAQPPATTPIPPPNNPNDPPASAPNGPQPLGHAIGDAGTALSMIRLLPASAPTNTILPGYSDKLPKQSALEVGFGLSSAQVNSESYLATEHSIAQASPGGVAVQGKSPQSPGSVAQTSPPDNTKPMTFGLNPPQTPLDALVRVGLMNGSAHARWSETLGPCVTPLSDASTSVANLSLLNAIPTLPGTTDLTGKLTDSKLNPDQLTALTDQLKALPGPLAELGGLLPGPGSGKGDGSLISLPNTLSTRSVVELVDIPGSANKAVRSTSTLQVASLNLLGGTPFAMSINVVSQPTLQVTSTGDAKTSTVKYVAPVLQVKQGDKVLYTLDAAHPTFDVPIGIPLPGLSSQLPDAFKKLPLVGDLANALPKDSPLIPKAGELNQLKLDIGVFRLSIAGLQQKTDDMTQPFKGHQLAASARMLDLQLLPTQALGLPGLPSALAQVSLGEQIARAAAPTGGVVCGTAGGPPAKAPPQKEPPLAYTSAYQAIPMFWTGTTLLMLGVIMVAALPRRRRDQP
ncbi:hypothetical protein LWC34_41685 [Kibdelosporangium philippinense]|uniref:Uncharacterized protein n=1 Tax=Kibdelosporangium philippinense TaxID=211113 RepID=A0ABS8ZTY5_9PSEU|nr:hypothetical protein [Kibdelosporangium philippinense]MCE7009282.1 hypothetical protein [Kibdelosporangium philippinense]